MVYIQPRIILLNLQTATTEQFICKLQLMHALYLK